MFNITPVHPETVSMDDFQATINPNVFVRPGATLIFSPLGGDALLVEESEVRDMLDAMGEFIRNTE